MSKHYFGKSNSWMYHKLNGIDGNRKPTVATDCDVECLKKSLLDVASRITSAAESLKLGDSNE